MKIVVVPGLFGSGLITPLGPFGAPAFVWGPTYFTAGLATILHLVTYLELNPDGTSVYTVIPAGVFQIYTPLINNLTSRAQPGQQISAWSYDWRYGPIQLGAELADTITEPTILVCHSYGCVVALECYKNLHRQGRLNLFGGAFFLGGPVGLNTSNYEILLAMNHEGHLYEALWAGVALLPLIGAIISGPLAALDATIINAADTLDQVMATLTSVAVNLPNNDMYTRAFILANFMNTHITDAWLVRGRSEFRDALSPPLIPQNLVYQIYGNGYRTADGWAQGSGFSFTQRGDGAVALIERLYDGNVLIIDQGHEDMLKSELVADFIMTSINRGIFVPQTVDTSDINVNQTRITGGSVNLTTPAIERLILPPTGGAVMPVDP